MELTVADVLRATGARVVLEPRGSALDGVESRTFNAAVIDSRRVAPGDLFVALPGTQTDGTRFVGDAFSRGALAALTSTAPVITDEQRTARGAVGADVAAFAALVVPDPLLALQQVARAWRDRHHHVRVVGITGSVGKTTAREAIAGMLGAIMPTLCAERSYNNEIGLPLTVLGLEHRHRALVLEMGAYGPGEIRALTEVAHPHVGVLTMVAPVHLERFGSIEAIAAAKAELVEALPPDGVAVLNGDDMRVRQMAALTPARAVLFGLGPDNDWRATEIDNRGLQGVAFTLEHHDWSSRVETGVVGRHFIYALLAAAAVAHELGMPLEHIAPALRQARIGERQRLLDGPGNRLIIDDAWNASEPSMLAALDVLATVPRRRVAVLGEMLELGAESVQAHRAVGRSAARVVAALVCVGRGGAAIAEEAVRSGLSRESVLEVATAADVPAALAQLLQPDDAVLVKGSRALRLESVVAWLAQATPAPETVASPIPGASPDDALKGI